MLFLKPLSACLLPRCRSSWLCSAGGIGHLSCVLGSKITKRAVGVQFSCAFPEDWGSIHSLL